jgi:peptidoglycan/LPS O-acetylase OafA/YrhL
VVTLGKVLEQNRGIGPGFDFLRIALAVSIMVTHAFLLTGNDWVYHSPIWYTFYSLVPMFFALSGFLIAGSAVRLSLKNFLINRGLRIIPALSVDTIVCAFIVGAIFTTYPLHKYFFNSQFFWYLTNVTGFIHYRLPGVFENNPDHSVNFALWTVPYEMCCYLIMSCFIVTAWVKRPFFIGMSVLAVLGFGLAVQHLYADTARPDYVLRALNFFLVFRGAQAVATFIMGIFVYQMRDRIPYSWLLFWICCGICLIGSMYLNMHDVDRVGNRFFFLPPLVYITVFLGLTKLPLPRFFHSGDYSYGVYLYHEPFLQCLVVLAPITIALKGTGAVLLFILGLPLAFGVAWTSWHFVEKPLLALRKKFSFVAKVRGVEDLQSSNTVAPTPVTDPGTA